MKTLEIHELTDRINEILQTGMKTPEIHELTNRINEILQTLEEEGETIEVTNGGEVIAHVVPVQKPQQPVKQELSPFWEKMEQLATEIGKHLPDKVDAVEIVREGRREF